jgi:hypothetical protein
MREDLSLDYHRWRSADEVAERAADGGPGGPGRRKPEQDARRPGRIERETRTEDEADEAFAAVYEACVSAPLPSAQFTAQTMAAIAAATVGDARRNRLVRQALLWSGVPAGAAAVYFGAGPLLSVLSSALVAGLNLLVAIVVWVANGPDVRSGVWSLMTGIGRAAAAFVADPRVTIAIVVFQVVAVAALAALHRLLGPEREWLK